MSQASWFVASALLPTALGRAAAKGTLAPVLDTAQFSVVPCRDCDVPGYLILIPKFSGAKIKDLPVDVQMAFGPAIGNVESAIRQVTQAERVYIMRFSEAMESVHFHLFPRTADMASKFLSENKTGDDGINGPLLFAWARKKYFVKTPDLLSENTLQTATKIAEYLSKK